MVRPWCPAFVSVIVVGELAVLTATDPKFNDAGLAAIPASALTVPTIPAQPLRYKTIRHNTSEHTNPLWVILVISSSELETAPGPEREPETGRVGSAEIDALCSLSFLRRLDEKFVSSYW